MLQKTSRTRRRRLHKPWLVALVVSTVLTCGAVHGVHMLSMGQQVQWATDRVARAERSGDTDELIKALKSYLKFRPNDSRESRRLAFLMHDQVEDFDDLRQALFMLENLVRNNPDDSEARIRVVNIWLAGGRGRDANAHLSVLLKNAPEDPELHYLHGRALHQQRKFEEARAAYEKAVSLDAQMTAAYVGSAVLYQTELNEPATAQVRIEQMAELGTPEALRSAVLFYLTHSPLREASTAEVAQNHLDNLLELDADGPVSLLLAAELESRLAAITEPREAKQTHWAAAREHLSRVIELDPEEDSHLLAVARLERSAGRLAEAKQWLVKAIDRETPDARGELVEVLLELGEIDEAEKQVALLDFSGPIGRGRLSFYQGQILVSKEQWRAGSRALEQALPVIESDEAKLMQASLLLGECYQRLLDPENALLAFRRAVGLDPFNTRALLGEAVSVLQSGRLDEAMQRFRGLTSEEGRLYRLNLLLARELGKNIHARSWEEVDETLRELTEKFPDSMDVQTAQAVVEFHKGKEETALAILQAAVEAEPDNPKASVQLAILYAQLGRLDEGRQTLTKLGDKLGYTKDVCAGWIQFWRWSNSEASLSELLSLEETLKTFKTEEQKELIGGLILAFETLGDRENASRLLLDQFDSHQTDLSWLVKTVELAGDQADDELFGLLVSRIEAVEGSDGSYSSYARAIRILKQAFEGKTQELPEARRLLESVARQRPTTSACLWRLAQIDLLEGDKDQALTNLQNAVKLGATQKEALYELIKLLMEKGRIAEANAVVETLNQTPQLSSEDERLISQLRFQANDIDSALLIAQRSAEDSKDYRDHLWLGQMLFAKLAKEASGEGTQEIQNSRVEEALSSLRKARSMAPDQPETLIALVRHLVVAGRAVEAREAISESEQELEAANDELALAQCYSLVGDQEKVEKLLYAALNKDPSNVENQIRLATHLLATDRQEDARTLLVKANDPNAKATPGQRILSRRLLAVILSSSRKLHQAADLLDQNIAIASTEVAADADLRLKVRILSESNSRKDRNTAVSLLEDFTETGRANSSDRYALARLYAKHGERQRCSKILAQVVADRPNNPVIVFEYTDSLVSLGQLSEAQLWADQLVKKWPDAYVTAAAQTKLLSAKGKPEQAGRLLEQFVISRRESNEVTKQLGDLIADNKLDEAVALVESATSEQSELARATISKVRMLMEINQNNEALLTLTQFAAQDSLIHQFRVLAAAFLLEELEITDSSEKMFREYVRATENPKDVFVLMQFLARQQRVRECLDLCEAALSTNTVHDVAQNGVAAIRRGKGSAKDCERLQRLLYHQEIESKDIATRLALADLHDYQGQYSKAEKEYRQIVMEEPNNPIALNNLAWLLALQGESRASEAIRLASRAIKLVGNAPALLDTRGVAYMAAGKPTEGLKDLEFAIDLTHSKIRAPARFFHLSQAYQRLGKKEQATKAWQDAQRAGLSAEALHPLELSAFHRLETSLQ